MSRGPVIIGAGASGLMAAITAARSAPGLPVTLLDSKREPGLKLLMSGGGRCNLTHVSVNPSDFHAKPEHALRHVLKAFSLERTKDFFEGIGVSLCAEEDGRIFPASGKAGDVLAALLGEAKRLGVGLSGGERVVFLKKNAGGDFLVRTEKREIRAARVVLATGGCSYPGTGSDGSGWKLARRLGHTVVAPAPALTPFLSGCPDWRGLSGISLRTRLSFYRNSKKVAESAGRMLFTHFGFSGPVCLDLSRWYSTCDKKDDPRIEANFLPGTTREGFLAFLERACPGGTLLRNALIKEYALPERFVRVLFGKLGIEPSRKADLLPARTKKSLAAGLFQYPLEIDGVAGFREAEVTAGGIPLSEVYPSTMESRLLPGLFFCGEMLDVDGRVGGFNLQWAWSSGAVAGRAAAEGLL